MGCFWAVLGLQQGSVEDAEFLYSPDPWGTAPRSQYPQMVKWGPHWTLWAVVGLVIINRLIFQRGFPWWEMYAWGAREPWWWPGHNCFSRSASTNQPHTENLTSPSLPLFKCLVYRSVWNICSSIKVQECEPPKHLEFTKHSGYSVTVLVWLVLELIRSLLSQVKRSGTSTAKAQGVEGGSRDSGQVNSPPC